MADAAAGTGGGEEDGSVRELDKYLPTANIARIMKKVCFACLGGHPPLLVASWRALAPPCTRRCSAVLVWPPAPRRGPLWTLACSFWLCPVQLYICWMVPALFASEAVVFRLAHTCAMCSHFASDPRLGTLPILRPCRSLFTSPHRRRFPLLPKLQRMGRTPSRSAYPSLCPSSLRRHRTSASGRSARPSTGTTSCGR